MNGRFEFALGVGCLTGTLLASGCSSAKSSAPSASATSSSGGIKLTVTIGSASASAAPAKPPADLPTGAFTAKLEGKEYKLAGAYIKNATQQDMLVLTTVTGGCDAPLTDADLELDFDLPTGPGGKHLAPGPFGGYIEISTIKSQFKEQGRGLYEATATLEKGDFKQGDKVKGTLKFGPDNSTEDGKKYEYSGGGAFEATVCDLSSDLKFQATPETVGTDPVTGTLGKAPFTAKSAFAMLEHDEARNTDYVNEIFLLPGDATCETLSAEKGKATFVKIYGREGASGTQKLIGSPQPRLVYFSPGGKDQQQIWGSAWAKFDQIDLAEKGTIKGTMFAETVPYDVKEHPDRVGKLAGAFTATVCK